MAGRRYHVKTLPGRSHYVLHECRPRDEGCDGKLHFYAMSDRDARALFDMIDERRAAEGT